jgi:hypothetical protein
MNAIPRDREIDLAPPVPIVRLQLLDHAHATGSAITSVGV